MSLEELTGLVYSKELPEVIRELELQQKEQTQVLAGEIAQADGVRAVFLAGPSSSGKTTFSHRLRSELEQLGRKTYTIEVDNYFIGREQTPLDEFGEKDYESLAAVDVTLFNENLQTLLSGETAMLPAYDFITGTRAREYTPLRIEKGDLLIIEGLHCLNEALCSCLPDQARMHVYLSVQRTPLDERGEPLSGRDVRLLRRTIRDERNRGYPAEKTLARWPSVIRGEDRYIRPYEHQADIHVDSGLIYEICVLKYYAGPLLSAIPEDNSNYPEAKRLLELLAPFPACSREVVPEDSLLQEFIP